MGFQATENMDVRLIDDEMTELTLLMPQSQVQGLESLAQEKGLSLAALLRSMIRQTLRNVPMASSPRFD